MTADRLGDEIKARRIKIAIFMGIEVVSMGAIEWLIACFVFKPIMNLSWDVIKAIGIMSNIILLISICITWMLRGLVFEGIAVQVHRMSDFQKEMLIAATAETIDHEEGETMRDAIRRGMALEREQQAKGKK